MKISNKEKKNTFCHYFHTPVRFPSEIQNTIDHNHSHQNRRNTLTLTLTDREIKFKEKEKLLLRNSTEIVLDFPLDLLQLRILRHYLQNHPFFH